MRFLLRKETVEATDVHRFPALHITWLCSIVVVVVVAVVVVVVVVVLLLLLLLLCCCCCLLFVVVVAVVVAIVVAAVVVGHIVSPKPEEKRWVQPLFSPPRTPEK